MVEIVITILISNKRQLGPNDVKRLVQGDHLTKWQNQHLLAKLDSQSGALYLYDGVIRTSSSYLKSFGLGLRLTSKQQIVYI